MNGWLIDTSAISRLVLSPDANEWSNRIDRGLVSLTMTTRMELGFTARNAESFRQIFERSPVALMPVEYLSPEIEDRALEVLGLLAERGQHRAPSIADLILAATAELRGLTVLHVDKDFELIAAITGQPVERLRLLSNRN